MGPFGMVNQYRVRKSHAHFCWDHCTHCANRCSTKLSILAVNDIGINIVKNIEKCKSKSGIEDNVRVFDAWTPFAPSE